MNKIKVLLKCPALSQSGYGHHSREIYQALSGDPLFDLYIENINWGICSFVGEHPLKKSILKCIEKATIAKHKGNENYDLFIHITVPHEFEKKGKFNIGITAGVETDRISHKWVDKLNEMDLIIVPSEFTKKVLQDTVINWHNQQTNESGQMKVDKPIEICSEGVNTELFKKKPYQDLIKLNLETDFNFLSVAQWGSGANGEDRKNITLLLNSFFQEFKNRKDVGLVLKTNMAKNTEQDFDMVKGRIGQIKQNLKIPENEFPPLYLVHANLSEEEMSDLYNHPKIKAFISPTHGERIWFAHN